MGWFFPALLGAAAGAFALREYERRGGELPAAFGPKPRSRALPSSAREPTPAPHREHHHHGPRFDVLRPYVLFEYPSGGGRPKHVEFRSTKDSLTRALHAAMRGEPAGWGDRHVFRMAHVSSQAELNVLSSESLARRDFEELARAQEEWASRHRSSSRVAAERGR